MTGNWRYAKDFGVLLIVLSLIFVLSRSVSAYYESAENINFIPNIRINEGWTPTININFIPNIRINEGWTHTLQIDNLNQSGNATYVIEYYNAADNTQTTTFGQISAGQSVEIATHTEVTAGFVGSAIVSSDQTITTSVTVGDGISTIDLPTFDSGTSLQTVEMNKSDNQSTLLQVQNTTVTAINIDIAYSDGGRQPICTSTVAMAGGASHNIDASNESCLPDPYQGEVTISTSDPSHLFVAAAYDVSENHQLSGSVSAVLFAKMSASPPAMLFSRIFLIFAGCLVWVMWRSR